MIWGSTAAILQAVLGRSRRELEPERGFEPLTYHLRGGCSARLSYSGGASSLPNAQRRTVTDVDESWLCRARNPSVMIRPR
jgi:hypothetical protein